MQLECNCQREGPYFKSTENNPVVPDYCIDYCVLLACTAATSHLWCSATVRSYSEPARDSSKASSDVEAGASPLPPSSGKRLMS